MEMCVVILFFFKQKTAYELRISDWSSDVCSSDLTASAADRARPGVMAEILFLAHRAPWPPDRGDRIRSWHMLEALARLAPVHVAALADSVADRKSVV